MHPGVGLQNMYALNNIPIYTTNSDDDITIIVRANQFEAIVVISDFLMLERLRRLGYSGPLIYEIQGFGTRQEAAHVLQEAVPILSRCCNAVILPNTSHLFELVIEICPWLQRFILPNMINTAQFKYVETNYTSPPVISWIGRLEPNKNWNEFLHIGRRLIDIHPEMKLWMFHDETIYVEEDKQNFYRTLDQLQLGPHIHLLSNVPHAEMPRYLSMTGDSGGILLSTSVIEGFGYAVAEAMCCHCPVLSTDSDGVRSFIHHNVTGKFYPLGHVDLAVAEALELMHNQELRNSIRCQAYTHIDSKFTPDQYGTSFVQIMNALNVF